MKSKSEFKRVATMNPISAAEEWWKVKEENEYLRLKLEEALQLDSKRRTAFVLDLQKQLEEYQDALEYCDRRSQLELEPVVMATLGNDMHYHAVLRMIRDEARTVLEKWKKK